MARPRVQYGAVLAGRPWMVKYGPWLDLSEDPPPTPASIQAAGSGAAKTESRCGDVEQLYPRSRLLGVFTVSHKSKHLGGLPIVDDIFCKDTQTIMQLVAVST